MIGSLQAQMPNNYQLKDDWLINNQSFTAKVTHNSKAERIEFGNGLFARTIDKRLGATVSFVNSMTGESIIRAVEPEGMVTIDGVSYSIGGADGQPNKAFLTKEWVTDLSPKKNSFQLVDFSVGEPKERLKWKRTRHHAPDVTWPPKGKTLRLDYRLPESKGEDLLNEVLVDSHVGREKVFSDNFEKLSSTWKLHSTKSFKRANFENEGKAGEIYTKANTAVYIERAIPEGTKIVEAEIHVGTDTSTSWGPGIAVGFENGKVIKFNIRPNGLSGVNRPVLGGYNGFSEIPNISGVDQIDTSSPIVLRARLAKGKLLLDAKQKGSDWKNYKTVVIGEGFGLPSLFRVGKMSASGESQDHSDKGQAVRLRVNNVKFFGAFDQSKLALLSKKKSALHDLTVSVHYEIYDGVPALSKWLTVTNNTGKSINLDTFYAEALSVVEFDNQVEVREGVPVLSPKVLHVETDMAFGGFSHRNANRHTVHWLTDKSYKTQVNWALKNPCLLKVEPSFGPDQTIINGGTFESFRVFELVYDSYDRERRGLALRKMYRKVAPWVTENPLMMHCQSSNEEVVRRAIDQAHETGFEVVILSFGSGFNSENDDPSYLKKWKEINDYALKKGIHLGSYSLYSSRSAGQGNDIVPPKGMSLAHGRCPAITSEWGQRYMEKLYKLFDKTGFMVFENDGTYPGDVDVTARPPLQKGVNDSRWVHWKIWTDFYKHLRSKGVFFNLPDYYYLSGSNKCGMGYREVNWSLPRSQQLIHTRQNIYDGTWEKTPSMGWMFVPLTQYHGGGAAVTIEPLAKHLDHYSNMMKSNLGMGVQAFYRGPRLYDTDETKAVVSDTVSWFKQHRTILESDMIHGRRADGQDIDWMLHVNPNCDEKAFLSVYNPTTQTITKTIKVPLYYSGLTSSTRVSANGDRAAELKLDRQSRASIEVSVPANGFSYYVFK